jgi:negative regulator of sigma E activity
MRKLFLTLGLAACAAAAALLAGCKATDTAGNVNAAPAGQAAPAPQAANPSDVAARITAAELKQKLDAGEAVVYDTRAKTAYDIEHIKGALSMPSNEVPARTGELPKDKLIVFYCT